MDAGTLKAALVNQIDARSQELKELALRIHSSPETGFHELNAANWLSAYLKDNGFSIDSGICELPTAFKASYGQGSPVIAVLAEYDALPGLGHACGHNLIAGCAVGAAVAARAAIDQFGGRILVIGTPAEETYGAKNMLAERGTFSDVDAAVMVHFETRDIAAPLALAIQNLEVEFYGKPAHAAAHPEQGINALEAMIQSFTAINSLRQSIRSTARIHGIITHGGDAVNTVPAYSAAIFMVRAVEDDYLGELRDRVLNCFVGAATASGARLEYKWGMRCPSLRSNRTLARLFRRNMLSLGRSMRLTDPGEAFGSTDFAVVSQLVPAIHPLVAIAPVEVTLHSSQFCLAAGSEAGIQGMLDAAKALGMTIADLTADPKGVSE